MDYGYKNLFINEEHIKKFNILLHESNSYKDNERHALFYAISGNSELWNNRFRIYNTTENSIQPKNINSLKISSSAKAILLASLNLYNSYTCYSIIDTFYNLDSYNFKLVMNMIRIRFPYK